MNTNMTGFRCFSKTFLHSCALDESSLNISIGRVKTDLLKSSFQKSLRSCVLDKSSLN